MGVFLILFLHLIAVRSGLVAFYLCVLYLALRKILIGKVWLKSVVTLFILLFRFEVAFFLIVIDCTATESSWHSGKSEQYLLYVPEMSSFESVVAPTEKWRQRNAKSESPNEQDDNHCVTCTADSCPTSSSSTTTVVTMSSGGRTVGWWCGAVGTSCTVSSRRHGR